MSGSSSTSEPARTGTRCNDSKSPPPRMPELPEVETIARQLRELVVNRTISEFESRWVRLTEPEPAEVVGARLRGRRINDVRRRSEEHTSELQSHVNLVCRLLLEK